MATAPLPTPEELRQLLRYEPETGRLFWLKRDVRFFQNSADPDCSCRLWNGRYADKPDFTAIDGKGYHHGSILNRNCRAHSVVWAVVHGEWPSKPIDHIDHDKTNNRICNLRMVSQQQNLKNKALDSRNTSGVTGVVWCKRRGKWQAQIGVAKRCVFLGAFSELDDAIEARKIAERKYAYHENHGI